MSTKLKLEMRDKLIVTIDTNTAKLSDYFRDYLRNCNEKNLSDPIKLTNIGAPVMQIAIRWLEHQRDNSNYEHKEFKNKPNLITYHKSKKRIDINNWDNEFLETYKADIYELLEVARILKIRVLFEIVAQKIAEHLSRRIKIDLNPLHASPNIHNNCDIINNLFGDQEFLNAREEYLMHLLSN